MHKIKWFQLAYNWLCPWLYIISNRTDSFISSDFSSFIEVIQPFVINAILFIILMHIKHIVFCCKSLISNLTNKNGNSDMPFFPDTKKSNLFYYVKGGHFRNKWG